MDKLDIEGMNWSEMIHMVRPRSEVMHIIGHPKISSFSLVTKNLGLALHAPMGDA